MADFRATNHGSLITLKPLSEAAEEWIDEHIPDDAQYWGNAVVIEPRYFGDIYEGILGDGLSFAEA